MSEYLQANPKLHIRRMQLSDIDAVMDIEPEAFGTHHWTRNNFLREMENGIATYLVVERDALVVGYIGVWIVIDEMHIVTLAVAPSCRRQGIAEALLLSVLDLAQKHNIRGVTLEVRLSNLAAQNLYRKYSFHRQGLRPNYYEDNKEAALLLWTEDLSTEKFRMLFEYNLAKYRTNSIPSAQKS